MIVATRAHQVHRELQAYRQLFEEAPVPYLVLDGHGRIEQLNVAAARLLGAERALAVNRSFVRVAGVVDPHRFGRWIERCRRGSRVSGELELAIGGAPRRLRAELAPLDGQAGGMSLVLVDGQAAYEQQLTRELREAVRARDDLLAVVAHDLGNPLSSILLATQLLVETVSQPQPQRVLRNVEQAARRMKRLVGDLLDAAALDAGSISIEPRPHAAAELVRAALVDVGGAATQAHIRLEADLPDDALRVHADPGRISQVLANLLTNAIKFTPPGGRISVGATQVITPVDRGVRFFVADGGPGIPEEQRGRLFDRFWKGQQHGTGLGLYIAKRILDAHGATMDVQSQVGAGSSFSFVLPLE